MLVAILCLNDIAVQIRLAREHLLACYLPLGPCTAVGAISYTWCLTGDTLPEQRGLLSADCDDEFLRQTHIMRAYFMWPMSMLPFAKTGVTFASVFCLSTMLPGLLHPAKSHIHVEPDGATVSWYPAECCHDRDCQPVASVHETPAGLWITTVDGQTLLVDRDEERRPSRDMRWHICLGQFGHNDVAVLCLFEPPST